MQHLVRMTTTTLKSIRTEEMYKLFWQKIITQANELDIAEPTSPNKLKAPRRYEVGVDTGVSPEDHFKAIYYEALYIVIGCIGDRFKQEEYQTYSKLEQLLIMEKQNEEDTDEMLKFYGSDFEKDELITQLCLFYANYPLRKEPAYMMLFL